MNKGRIVWLAAAFVLGQAAPAQAAGWAIDSQHSSAGFKVKHMIVSNVSGQFGGVSGSADYDGKDVKTLKVNAEIDTTTINTGEAGRDDHLRNPDFFDVDKYPKIIFKSTKVVPQGEGKFQLVGDLTMHGVTKSVTLSVEGPSPVLTDAKGTSRVGASATATLNRKEFGITYNKVLDNGGVSVGEDVKIDLEIEMTKSSKKASN
jgi:polyisoprenoid-binding protein YceI